MKLKIVAVRDSAAEAFGQPNFVLSIGGAVRSFGDEVARVAQENAMNRHPEHFSLFELGEYDDNSGMFALLDAPRPIAYAVDFVSKS